MFVAFYNNCKFLIKTSGFNDEASERDVVPGHGDVEYAEKLFQRRLVHQVHQTHFTDQKVEDAAARRH